MTLTEQNFLKAKRALFDKYYSFLNPVQRSAVFKVNGPLLILAGAGSGKTTVLVNRLSYLLKYGDAYNSDFVPEGITDRDVDAVERAVTLDGERLGEYLTKFTVSAPLAWSVMAITFTNKAAGEIKERIAKAFEGEEDAVSGIYAGTFHSICMRFLRRWADRLGYTSDYGICDADDAKKLIAECMKELEIDPKSFAVKNIMNAISSEKDKLRTPADTASDCDGDVFFEAVSKVYALYQKKLKASNVVDFDDIIMLTVKLFEENPDILSEVQRKFKYISVDEYQDTNFAQFRLVTLIADGWKNVMAVGDDDQSIYKFRGATIKNIMDFDKIYPDAKVIKLEQNYRSTKKILSAANAVIKNNSQRRGKNLWTSGDEGEPITIAKLENQLDEAKYISDTVFSSVSSGKCRYRDIAVLYRTNAQSRSIEQTFAKSGIPYRMLGSLRFFDRQEIKDMLAYLSVINNPKDTVHLKRIINMPRRMIGAKSVEVAEMVAYAENKPLLEIIRNADKYSAIPPAASRSMVSFGKFIEEMRNSGLTVSSLIDRVSVESGYVAMLAKAEDDEKDRIENIGELISTAAQYEDSAEEPTLSEFLEDVALVSDVDRYDESADAVVLMTIHSAKGLEFPTVFLPGMEEGLFPGFRAISDESEIEEERRLAYVAITRAKKKLYISYVHERLLNGSTNYNNPSRFVGEIPEELCEMKGFAPRKPSYSFDFDNKVAVNASPYRNRYGVSTKKSTSAVSASGKGHSIPVKSPFEEFSEGDRVTHSAFGDGTVISAKHVGPDIMYEINFDKVGTKKLMATYARLKKA